MAQTNILQGVRRLKVRVVILLVGILLVLAGGRYGSAATGEQPVALTMADFKFTPAQVSLRAGVPAQIRLGP